jgi:hypothetical protein
MAKVWPGLSLAGLKFGRIKFGRLIFHVLVLIKDLAGFKRAG